MTVMDIIRKTLNIVKNFFFTPECIFCEKHLEINEERYYCKDCEAALELCHREICCEKCGKPIVSHGEKVRCYFCLNHKPLYYDRIIAPFKYAGIVKESVLRFKSGRFSNYLSPYGDFMTAELNREYGGIEFDAICCIPSHNPGTKDYGEENVELLAECISKKARIPIGKGKLVKIRETRKQKTLGYKDRLDNVKDCMTVTKPAAVKDKTILLIDDVCTTRATLIEGSRALKKAGAKRVYALTVATTTKEND